MIDFADWLRQIARYCTLVGDDTAIRAAWVQGDLSRTSVSGFDELYVQVFDDLDSEAFVKRIVLLLPDDPSLCEKIERFFARLEAVDDARMRRSELKSDAALLDSSEWKELREAALSVSAHIERSV